MEISKLLLQIGSETLDGNNLYITIVRNQAIYTKSLKEGRIKSVSKY